MSTFTIKIQDTEISTLVDSWMEAIEKIPDTQLYTRMQVREKSASLWDTIRFNADVLKSGIVSVVVSAEMLLAKSKEYAGFVYSLPEDVRSLFNTEFEAFWSSLCSKMNIKE